MATWKHGVWFIQLIYCTRIPAKKGASTLGGESIYQNFKINCDLLIDLLNKYRLSIYHVPGTILDLGDADMNKTKISSTRKTQKRKY